MTLFRVVHLRLLFGFAIAVLCYLIFWTRSIGSGLIGNEPVSLDNISSSVSFEPKNISILLWNPQNCTDCAPFPAFKSGNVIFMKHRCEYQNCYIHPNEMKLPDVNPENYDAIMFNGRPIQRMSLNKLPKIRHEGQIYIYVQMESSVRFPLCQKYFDDFFNWTMTYRLDSDIPWTYFEVKGKDNVAVGPSKTIKWMAEGDLQQVHDDLKAVQSHKSKLAAWFVSNCYSGNSGRINFVKDLERELKSIDNHLTVDIYGKCGTLNCFRNETNRCIHLIERDYKFYLAMENSFEEDYITEKVLLPLQHNAIPVVYGSANYTRFLPPGSYLDAKALGPQKLAKKMYQLHKNIEEYHKYFRWKSEYSFRDRLSNAAVACDLCNRLNTHKGTTRHLKFREWWNKEPC